MTKGMSQRTAWMIGAGATCWIAVVCAGLGMLSSHANTPGLEGEVPAQWPSGSGVSLARERVTLVMLAHPLCPCTRASVGELDRLMARLNPRLTAHVLFYLPEDPPAGWTHSDLWDKAAAIPGVSVSWDRGGLEAQRFGAATSGQVVVYDARGHRLFSGGITASRGHAGDNPGSSSIIAALSGTAPARAKTPIFGCSLLNSPPRRKG